jgi:hypothetical protein
MKDKIDKSKMTAGQKAAYARKWRRAQVLANYRARNAKTFTKYLLSKRGYKCISLDTRKGYEYKGIIDLVAVKRDKRDPDCLEIIFVQVKGGEARITAEELKRLHAATKSAKIYCAVAEKPAKTVLFRNKI